MPDNDLTADDTTGTGTTGTGTTRRGTKKTSKKGRGQGDPQPLTVFTGSHGLQADKPRAGEDADQPDDTDTTTADPDSRPDLRR